MSTANPDHAMGPTHAVRLNQESWDERAVLHSQDPNFYDTDSVLRGASSLRETELALAGDVTGARLLHLQCHLGLDTLSWARRGARPTGVDFSPVAVAKAHRLAERAGQDVAFVHADVCNLPVDLHQRFDLAVATYGIFTWIGDLSAWANNAAATLAPGGRLIVVDLHPLIQMIEQSSPLEVDFPYANNGPHHCHSDTSYANPTAPLTAADTIQWAHSVGEIITAVAKAGLRIEQVDEPLSSDHNDRPGVLTAGTDGRWRLDIWGKPLPVLLAVLASKPA